MEPAIWSEMGASDAGLKEPRLVMVWPDPTVPTHRALAFAHRVAADVHEARDDRGSGWLIVAPDRVERTATSMMAVITARTWPRSEIEAQEALTLFEAVAEEARRLRREVEELARGLLT